MQRNNGKSTRLKSFSLKSHHKQQMLMGGEERKNKVGETPRTPRSRSTRFPSLRGEMDWWKSRSRSPLSNPSKICKNHGRNWERGKLSKVNNGEVRGGKTCLQELPLWGRRGPYIGPQDKEPLQENWNRIFRFKFGPEFLAQVAQQKITY